MLTGKCSFSTCFSRDNLFKEFSLKEVPIVLSIFFSQHWSHFNATNSLSIFSVPGIIVGVDNTTGG